MADNALYGVLIDIGALGHGDKRFAAVVCMMPWVKGKAVNDDFELAGIYDISTDPHYNAEEKAVVFDGTFGIDTGVQLFATDEDFTVIASFQLESFGKLGLLNYSFIPVFSSMNYSDDKANCPGFDVGLILAEGTSADAKPVGGFITVRNYWEYTQCPSIDIPVRSTLYKKGDKMLESYSVLKNGNRKLSEHFKVREFFCRDGSDPVFIDTELVEILEKIRVHFDKPVTITSAYRTAAYNATVAKAAKYSQHLYGKAADIQVQGISVEQVYAYADKLLAGRGGVGIYPPGLGRANGWVHVDVRKEKSRWRG